MADATSVLNEFLEKRGGSQIKPIHFSHDRINEFLKEAYQINRRITDLISNLRSIRQPYLSTAPPPRRKNIRQEVTSAAGKFEQVHLNDADRDQIDAEAKSVLRDLDAAIKSLSNAERTRQEAEVALLQKRRQRKGFGALGKWAAGGGVTMQSPEEEQEDAQISTIKLHRDGVIWFLRRRLEYCSTAQSSMMEIRIQREMEKSKSILHKATTTMTAPNSNVFGPGVGNSTKVSSSLRPDELDSGTGASYDFDDEEAKLLAQENQDMLKGLETKQDQVRKVESSMVEISELQSTLASNLEIQSANIEQLVRDSFFATENVGSGNKELKRASERRSTAKAVFFGTAGLCGFLLLWDLII